ncbi:GNAT family N-acetyltransferase [Halobacteriales archaeon QS_5_70_17]|nr:MAG: GNAT family N-acetyltransferase [Halobacteriales archaeon QS_5_70_17]
MDATDGTVRPYDPTTDWSGLWTCKRAFERELAAGDGAKADRYEGKLTAEYRERYRAWVADCVDREPDCVVVCEGDGEVPEAADAPAGVVGYAFVLPADFAMIWDGAVLNELYLAPDLRGTGSADALIDAAVEHARGQELPLDRLLLDVGPDNERARAFYERHGFEPWGEMVARDLT